MIKLAGILFVITACSLVGISMSQALSKRVRELKLVLVFIDKLKTHIQWGKTPTKQAITELAKDRRFLPLLFLKETAKNLASSGNFPLIWRQAVSDKSKSMQIDHSDTEYISGIANILGSSDEVGQINALTLTETMIKQNLEIATRKKEVYGKLYNSLGVLTGGIIAIFLL